MKINFSPCATDAALHLEVLGDTLIINNVSFDFSVIPEGAILPDSAVDHNMIVGDVSRTLGQIELTVMLPCRFDSPEAIRFPESVTVTDGVVIDTSTNIYPWAI